MTMQLMVGDKPSELGDHTLSEYLPQPALAPMPDGPLSGEANIQVILDGAADAIFIANANGQYIYVNLQATTLLGFSRDELLSMSIADITPTEDLPATLIQFEQLLKIQSLRYEPNLRRRDGSIVPVELNCVVLPNGSIYGSCRDISARRLAEQDRQEAYERHHAVLRTAMDGFWQADARGHLIEVNASYCAMSGYSEQELLTMHITDLEATETRQDTANHIRRIIEHGSDRFESIHRHKDGRVFDVALSVQHLSHDGGRFVVFIQDITERKNNHRRLLNALAEKDALLKEVHHRVKNNLQVITSLLRLETRRNTESNTKAVLGDMQARIKAMALLHESLYRSGTFASVDLGLYLGKLAAQVIGVHAVQPELIKLKLDLGAVKVGMDQATAAGLVLNELISNCLKHGFPNGQSGEIYVELKPVMNAGQLTGDKWCLLVSDTGAGLPADFEERRKTSLGLQLADDLSSQLGGALSIDSLSDSGARFSITFTAFAPAPLVVPK